MHAENHVKGLMFPCRYCAKVYSTRSTLKGHTQLKHRAERKLKASILKDQSNEKRENKNDLDKEIDGKVEKLMVKEGKLWKCKHCDKISSRANITRHCEIHLTGYTFHCHLCPHKTTNRVALKEHVPIKHH